MMMMMMMMMLMTMMMVLMMMMMMLTMMMMMLTLIKKKKGERREMMKKKKKLAGKMLEQVMKGTKRGVVWAVVGEGRGAMKWRRKGTKHIEASCRGEANRLSGKCLCCCDACNDKNSESLTRASALFYRS